MFSYTTNTMIKIFLKLISRNFLKGGLLNVLNVLGLALGITATLLITLYAEHEFSYDSFHKNSNNIFRMEARTNSPLWFSNLGAEHSLALISGKYPEVVGAVMLNGNQQTFLSANGNRFPENHIYQTNLGSAFFTHFDFNLIEGNTEGILDEPYSAVITESTRQRYFNDAAALGQTLNYDSIPLKITGVIEDLPSNSHFDFEILYTNPRTFANEHFHTNTYFQLVDGASPQDLEAKIMAMEGIAPDAGHEFSEVKLIALPDIYFNSNASFGSGGIGDQLQLKVFMVIGILIVLISVANYVNLSMAIYSSKGLEIGMRKVLGESKGQIIRAFIYESILVTMLSIPIMLICLKFTLPVFSEFLDINLENKLISSPIYWIGTLVFLLVVSFITVIYPASVLNNTKISALIKSKTAVHHTGGIKLRNILLFFQFIILFTLGISAWFMNRQINYMDNKDMGFSAEKVIKIRNAFNIGNLDNYKVFKTELLKNPQVAAVAFGPMMGDGMAPLAYKTEGSDEIRENLLSYGVDIDYFEVMSMDILAGEFKNKLISSEDGKIISLVNKSFIDQYGWQDDPIGKKIILRPGTENELQREVSAVFEDFHFFSLKEKVAPQIISLRPDPLFVNTNILVKSAIPDLKEVVKLIEEQWYALRPDVPFEYDLMDAAVKKLYDRERQTSQVSLSFSLLAISLSLLGLIGFMIYLVSLKSKELAVRKVLGATLLQIVGLLNRQLMAAILLASIIGSGLSYWLISRWLNDYAYTIKMNPETFVIALILVYGIVFIITAIQSMKSSHANPVMALKNE